MLRFTRIRKMAEKKQGTLHDFFSLKKTQSEPPRSKNLTRESIRAENHGDPWSNEYGQKFLSMPLDEKRKLYRCGENYVTIKDFVTWSTLWHIKQDSMQRKCKAPETSYTVNQSLNNKICLHQGDITRLEIDGIINAANESLLGGGGVDGFIHKAAGSSLFNECKSLNGCNTGDAKITSGHCLPAKYIIHTVGPVGKHPHFLSSCYKNSLEMALKFKVKTLAFPCISTGVFGYPQVDAAHVALKTVREWLESKDNAENVELIIFCVYLSQDWNIYTDLLQSYFPCKEPSASRQISEDEDTKELEADVLNVDNIPTVDDFADLLQEDETSRQESSDEKKSQAESDKKDESLKDDDSGVSRSRHSAGNESKPV